MQYKRMPIEIEAPEGFGYENIDCNLSESSFTDQKLSDLDIHLQDLALFYGDHKGKPDLRKLLANEYDIDPEEILITAGAAAALFIIASSQLNQHDHLVLARPNYATNIETPRTIGAEISFLDLKFEESFALDIEALEKLIRPNTKLVSLTYPHNPTGVTIDEKKLREILALIERRKTVLLLDETYREMSFGPPPPLAASLSKNVISVSSMSKSFGLPGIRIGWIICRNREMMETFLAAKEQIFITNSILDEEIAFRFLQQKEKHFSRIKETIGQNFMLLKQFMENQDLLEWIEPGGGCVCFPRIKSDVNLDLKQFHEDLIHRYKTYIGPGHWFEQDDRYLRIGYGWDKQDKLLKGLQNILSAIEGSKK